MTAKIDIRERLNMMQNYGFRTSQKSMEFKDNCEQLKILIGKKASKRYRVVVGPGMTPI